jgi:hypothetical protein
MSDHDSSLSPEAVLVCQVLLNHQRSIVRLKRRPPFQQCLITYGEVCEAAGLPLLTEAISICLWEIAEFCADNGWPPLNAIVINARTREPGKGYEKAPGCSRESWLDEAQRCLDFAHYPDLVTA